MTFEEAIRKSMKAYYKDMDMTEMNKSVNGKMKYTKKYFNKFEEEEFGTSTDWKTLKEMK